MTRDSILKFILLRPRSGDQPEPAARTPHLYSDTGNKREDGDCGHPPIDSGPCHPPWSEIAPGLGSEDTTPSRRLSFSSLIIEEGLDSQADAPPALSANLRA